MGTILPTTTTLATGMAFYCSSLDLILLAENLLLDSIHETVRFASARYPFVFAMVLADTPITALFIVL